MKIFYNLATGEPVGTVDGFAEHLNKVTLEIPGVEIGEVNIKLGDELEYIAKRVMEPTDSLGIYDLHIDPKTKHIRELDSNEKNDIKSKKDKAIKENAVQNKPRDLAKEVDDLKKLVESLQTPKPSK